MFALSLCVLNVLLDVFTVNLLAYAIDYSYMNLPIAYQICLLGHGVFLR